MRSVYNRAEIDVLYRAYNDIATEQPSRRILKEGPHFDAAMAIRKFGSALPPLDYLKSIWLLTRIWALLNNPDFARNQHDIKARTGYVKDDGGCLPNQFHLQFLSEHLLDEVRSFLIVSGIADICATALGCPVGASNVRAWRYVHGETSVGEHEDKITPAFLKVMIFKGVVGVDDGALEYLDHGGWKIVTGENRVIIFNPNALRHRARAPAPGHIRDCIEVTIIPRIEDDFLVASGGYAAGMPINPFRKWDE